MAKSKTVLGKGLSALLKDNDSQGKRIEVKQALSNFIEVSTSKIKKNPYQPRITFDKTELNNLANSIKELGVIQPITVRKIEGEDNFELISGERRLLACGIAGLEVIPAFIRLADDQEMLEMALVENIQRKDLDPIEVALSYQRLIEEIKLTQEELSKRVGKERSTVSNYLRILKLNPVIQTAIREGIIGLGHGKALISLEDEGMQLKAFEEIIKKSFSVRNSEQYVQNLKSKKNKPSRDIEKTTLPKWIFSARKELTDLLERKVEINRSQSGSGKLVIHFENDKDFEKLQKRMLEK